MVIDTLPADHKDHNTVVHYAPSVVLKELQASWLSDCVLAQSSVVEPCCVLQWKCSSVPESHVTPCCSHAVLTQAHAVVQLSYGVPSQAS